jgi:hypothetical protein
MPQNKLVVIQPWEYVSKERFDKLTGTMKTINQITKMTVDTTISLIETSEAHQVYWNQEKHFDHKTFPKEVLNNAEQFLQTLPTRFLFNGTDIQDEIPGYDGSLGVSIIERKQTILIVICRPNLSPQAIHELSMSLLAYQLFIDISNHKSKPLSFISVSKTSVETNLKVGVMNRHGLIISVRRMLELIYRMYRNKSVLMIPNIPGLPLEICLMIANECDEISEMNLRIATRSIQKFQNVVFIKKQMLLERVGNHFAGVEFLRLFNSKHWLDILLKYGYAPRIKNIIPLLAKYSDEYDKPLQYEVHGNTISLYKGLLSRKTLMVKARGRFWEVTVPLCRLIISRNELDLCSFDPKLIFLK